MRRRRSAIAIAARLLLTSVVVAVTPGAPVGAVPAGFTDSLVATVSQPTSIKVLPGGELLVLERAGALRRIRADGTVVPAGSIPVCTEGERGLRGFDTAPTTSPT